MAGLMLVRIPLWPWLRACAVVVVLLLPLLAWPSLARAGWFVRDNQVAYDLSQEGHDRQALKHWDQSAEGWYGRGTALLHLGRMQEAERAFRLSLALAPHKTGFSDQRAMPAERKTGFMASLWYNLGNALYAQGRLGEARQAWLSALRFRPGHAKARRNLEIVDRLLKERERESQPVAGLTASKHKQAGKNKTKPAEASQSQQQQPAVQHGLLPLHREGASGQAETSNASGSGSKGSSAGASQLASNKEAQHATTHRHSRRPTPHRDGTSGTGNGNQHSSRTGGKGMSQEQASRELGMVDEGVSVFLRHRLREKSSQAASGTSGEPW
jgi:tetratricopeptide (TPR) repeat protein